MLGFRHCVQPPGLEKQNMSADPLTWDWGLDAQTDRAATHPWVGRSHAGSHLRHTHSMRRLAIVAQSRGSWNRVREARGSLVSREHWNMPALVKALDPSSSKGKKTGFLGEEAEKPGRKKWRVGFRLHSLTYLMVPN